MTRDKPILLLDVDNVVADFSTAYTDIAQSIVNRRLPSPSTHDCWDMRESLQLTKHEHALVESVLYRPGIAQSLEIYWSAEIGVRSLFNYADVVFVTSPMDASSTWVYDRHMWLVKHFGLENVKVINTFHKEYVRGDIFVDDKVSNVRKWLKMQDDTAVGLLWDQPYNRVCNDPGAEGVERARDWNTVLETVKNFKEVYYA